MLSCENVELAKLKIEPQVYGAARWQEVKELLSSGM